MRKHFVINSYYTDENGMIELPELDTGWYKVKEFEPPAGYMLKEPSEQILCIEHEKGSSMTFKNTAKSALVIRKIDFDTGAPLSDVQFFISTSDGAVEGNANGYFTTDSAGTILVSDIKPGTTLVVKETRTRPG